MHENRAVATVVLVESEDVMRSIGRPRFLKDHLKPANDSGLTVDVLEIPGGRCDLVAQRLDNRDRLAVTDVPPGLESWFAVMTAPVEIPETTSLFIMSMADAVVRDVWRHTKTGVLVQTPAERDQTWTDEEIAWLHEQFEPAPPSDEQLTLALRSIRERLDQTGAEFVIFNTSTFMPGEKASWFKQGDSENASTRSARTNLIVDRLVKELDLSLVDVDRVTAELGAGVAVVDRVTYSSETLDVLRDEAITTILDLEGISNVFASDAMQLTVPRYDRRTTEAMLVQWHVAQGSEVTRGEPLFDLAFSNLRRHSKQNTQEELDKTIAVSVVAGRSGYVDSLSVEVGAPVVVGARVGIVTSTPSVEWDDIDNAARFPVGIRVIGR